MIGTKFKRIFWSTGECRTYVVVREIDNENVSCKRHGSGEGGFQYPTSRSFVKRMLNMERLCESQIENGFCTNCFRYGEHTETCFVGLVLG